MESDPGTSVLQAVADIAGADFTVSTPEQIMRAVADGALHAVPRADAASVTLIHLRGSRTAASTGLTALDLDEHQYDIGQGPCFEAAMTGRAVRIDDMATDERWPDFARYAVGCGVLSSLCIGLPARQKAYAAGLNLYAVQAGAFDERATAACALLARHVAPVIANAELYARSAARAEELRQALDSRAVVNQAVGIVMGDRGCSPAEGFAVLHDASAGSDRTLHDVAVAVVRGAQRGTRR